MRIRFLESSARDLDWMRRYYKNIFADGSRNAQKHYLAAIKTIGANAHIGHASDRVENAREYPIPRTPFIFIYRVKKETIEILRVLDGRAEG